MQHRLLLVDDQLGELEALKECLERRSFAVDAATSGAQAIDLISAAPNKYTVVVLDYDMPGLNGAETTQRLLQINSELRILIFSGREDTSAFLLPSRSGARALVSKKEGLEVLLRELNRLCVSYEKETITINQVGTAHENEKLIASIGMIGRSKELAAIARDVMELRDKNGPVLILGESGTGKEMIATALHQGRKGNFIAKNCADFLYARDTSRSDLFGHVKGSFTGATQNNSGIFVAAEDGTAFLDEVYALPMDAQVALLRTLQEKKVTPMGSTQEIAISCRIVAAAKPDLIQQIASGTFKPDLFYRISQRIIMVPSLAQRPDDIGPLVKMYCEKWCIEYGQEKTFLASTLPLLERYSWPGNAREIEHLVYSVLSNIKNSKAGPRDLPAKYRGNLTGNSGATPGTVQALDDYVDAAKKEGVIDALEYSHSIRGAAKRLKVSPQTVLRLIKKFDLNVGELLSAKRAKTKLKDRA